MFETDVEAALMRNSVACLQCKYQPVSVQVISACFCCVLVTDVVASALCWQGCTTDRKQASANLILMLPLPSQPFVFVRRQNPLVKDGVILAHMVRPIRCFGPRLNTRF